MSSRTYPDAIIPGGRVTKEGRSAAKEARSALTRGLSGGFSKNEITGALDRKLNF